MMKTLSVSPLIFPPVIFVLGFLFREAQKMKSIIKFKAFKDSKLKFVSSF